MAGEEEVRQFGSVGELWKNFKIPILLGGVAIFCIALSITLFIKSYQSSAPIQFSTPLQDSSDQSSASATLSITVDVAGAVAKPGVYTLGQGSRVEDAISLAGGFAGNADAQVISQTINRAAKLVDGAKVYVPALGERVESTSGNVAGVTTKIINVNTATMQDLESLSGIGPVTAQKIIDNRPYQTLEELVSKKALGQSTFDKLKSTLGI